jgi:tripartite-type tricarboxylate transporter receptor subunit TctC
MGYALRALAFALALVGLCAAAHADDYPSRSITIVVPFPPGGPTDSVGRIMADHMKQTLGQPVIVENVSGAGGTIGTTRAVRAAADGYTLVVGQWTSHVGAGAMYNLPYDQVKDLQPISLLTSSPLWIIGRKDLPAKDLRELIAGSKEGGRKLSAATIGAGSGAHMCLLYLSVNTGAQFQYVPYRGGAPVMQDLVANQIDVSCLEAGQTLGQFRDNRIKAYAVMGKERWFQAPEVPTADEAGASGLTFPFWHGMWAPKGTPSDVVAKINHAVREAFADPAVRKRFADLGHVIPPPDQLTPEALATYHQAEVDKWFPLIKSANIKAD